MALQIIVLLHLQVVQLPLTVETLCSSGTGEMKRRCECACQLLVVCVCWPWDQLQP